MTGFHIGISGWTYPPWRDAFYPSGLTQRQELAYCSRHFNSLEINGSFYALQRPASYRSWYEQTPENFVFTVKGSRFITHMKKLQTIEVPLANFFASGRLRYAFEVRHPSFLCQEFIELLRQHQVALVFADSAGR